MPIDFRVISHDVAVTPHGRPFTVLARNRSRKIVVAYGVRVFRRDDRARLVAPQGYVVRPHGEFAPRREQPLALRLDGVPPEYELRATFALHDDGTWSGDADLARREISSFREEFTVVHHLAQVLAAVGGAPTRDDLLTVSEHCSRSLALARSRGARRQLEAALRRLAVGLDEQMRAGRSCAEILAVVSDRVDQALAGYDRLGFVRRSPIKG